jgi:hypothetical protein
MFLLTICQEFWILSPLRFLRFLLFQVLLVAAFRAGKSVVQFPFFAPFAPFRGKSTQLTIHEPFTA